MAYQVRIQETAQSFEVAEGEAVLAAALRCHVEMPHDCQAGGCGTCRIKLLSGAVAYDEFPMGLTPPEELEGYALACQALPQTDLVVSVPARAGARAAEHFEGIIAAKTMLSPDVVHLALDLRVPTRDLYVPGQHANFAAGDGTRRSFSMASAPKADRIDFHIKRIEGGAFTDRTLGKLGVGDSVDIELPLGSFRFRSEDYRPILMIATGTGLAPLKAMLEALMDDPGCPPVSLYWGGRTPPDLYLDGEIRAWSGRLYEFRYVPVLSRAGDAWSGRRGYVQDAVVADIPDLSEYAVYLCGSPEMVRDAKETVIGRGADIDFVYSEAFTAHV